MIKLQLLCEEVLDRTTQPRDYHEVAAIIESLGWTDAMVAEEFGYEDVFELARAVFDRLPRIDSQLVVPTDKRSMWTSIAAFIRSFFRGIMFAMPIAVSIFAMLTVRYSLWAYQYFSVHLATSIAIGTAMSFVATGGFTQALARRGLMYVVQQEYGLARRLSYRVVFVGLISVLVLGAASVLFNWLFSVLPWSMAWVTFVYYVFLSVIWLSIAVLYMLHRELLFTIVMSAGIALVIFLHEQVRLSIVVAQVIGLTATSVVSLMLAAYLLYSAELRREEPEERVALPRASIVIYTSAPYFAYGLLYFSFLYLDRFISWSANSAYMPFVVWFRGQYEIGLDWAMLALVLPMGVVESALTRFMDNLVPNQKRLLYSDTERFGTLCARAYIKQLALYTGVSLLSAMLVSELVRLLEKQVTFEVYLSASHVSMFVFRLSLFAYVLLGAGLFNVLIFFCLSRPEMALRAVASAIAVDFVVGFVLSRWLGYEWAAAGLLAGSVVFFVAGSIQVLKVMHNMDYHYYYASS